MLIPWVMVSFRGRLSWWHHRRLRRIEPHDEIHEPGAGAADVCAAFERDTTQRLAPAGGAAAVGGSEGVALCLDAVRRLSHSVTVQRPCDEPN
jgi:hypothetical protein